MYQKLQCYVSHSFLVWITMLYFLQCSSWLVDIHIEEILELRQVFWRRWKRYMDVKVLKDWDRKLGSKITKFIFFQFFHNKSLWFCFKSEWQFFWGFFWGILPFCKSKIGDVRIFAYFFFHFDLDHFRNILRPNCQPHWPQWGLKI